MSSYGDFDVVLERAIAQGFRHCRTAKGHHQFYAPNGRDIIVTGGTPGDLRAFDNFIASMKRAGYRPNGEATPPAAATTSLGDALTSALQGETKARAPEPVPLKVPVGGLIALVRDAFRSHPERLYTTAEIVELVAARGLKSAPDTVRNCLSTLADRSEIVRVERGVYRWPKTGSITPDSPSAAVEAAKADPHVAVDPPPGATDHDDQDPDERELDESLAALGRIETAVRDALGELGKIEAVVRRNKASLAKLRELRRLLNQV